MAFNNYGYGGYPGYYPQPMQDQLAQLRSNPAMAQQQQPMQTAQQPQATSNGILWCQGEESAKGWMVAPGNTVLLMDSDGSCFYLKSVDASGMPQPLRIFDYKERVTAPKTAHEAPQTPVVDYVTRADFDALSARYDAIAAELEALKAKKDPVKKSVKEDDD